MRDLHHSFRSKVQLFTTALCALVWTSVRAQTVDWIVPIGGPSNQHGFDVAVDHDGNVVVCGETYGAVNFHPGTADSLVPYPGSWQDAYLAKYAPDGSLTWGVVLGGPNTDILGTVATDPLGNVYAGGFSGGGFDIDPGPDTSLLPAETATGLLMKMNAEGHLLWARGLTNADCNILRVASTVSGGVICMGTFTDTLDADPGPDSTLLINSGAAVFLANYDADGDLLWAEHFGGTHPVEGYGMEVADNGDVVLALNFRSTLDADPGPDTLLFSNTLIQEDIALLRIDPAGQLIWADHIHGSSNAEISRTLTIDDDGDIILAGWFCFTTDLDPGPGVYEVTSTGDCETFVARYDSAGAFLSAFIFGDVGVPIPLDIAVRSDGMIQLVGKLVGTNDMDPGTGEFLLTPAGPSSGFVAFYGPDGTLLTADLIGTGSVPQAIFGATVDDEDRFLITGTVSGTSDMAPGPFEQMYTPEGAQDAYVTKFGLSTATSTVEGFGAPTPISLSPNPARDAFMISAPERWQRLELVDPQGRSVLLHTAGTAPFQLDISGCAEGIHLLRMTTSAGAVRSVRVLVCGER